MTSFFMPNLHMVDELSSKTIFQKKKKMAEEQQKYKDILKHEREEFRKQLQREVSISGFLFNQIQINNVLN